MALKYKNIVFYPILLNILPVASLYTSNLYQASFIDTFRPLLIIISTTFLLFIFFRILLRSWEKAGLLLTILSFFFFYFSFIIKIVGTYLQYLPYYQFLTLLLLTWILFLLISLSVNKTKNHKALTYPLNVISLALILYHLVLIANHHIQTRIHKPQQRVEAFSSESIKVNSSKAMIKRDIYYIILDGYSRKDVLNGIYGYDNSKLLDFLEAKGFYIASSSHSNYGQTLLSLSSSLNMKYLDDLLILDQESENRLPLNNLIINNYVRNFLKSEGYHFLTMDSGYEMTNIIDSDLYLKRKNSLSFFERTLIDNSFAKIISGYFAIPAHREQMLGQFDQLEQLAESQGLKFVFSHFVIPHPPFLLDELGQLKQISNNTTLSDGNHFKGTDDQYRSGYISQLKYVNYRIEKIVEHILAQPGPDPIIIIQADHGSGLFLDHDSFEGTCLWERLSILNALYLPDGGQDQLYDEITPVNTFRTILNYYFNTSFPILEDKSYYSTWMKPYEFYTVNEEQINRPCKTTQEP